MTRWVFGAVTLAISGTAQAQVYGAPSAGGGVGIGSPSLGGLNAAYAPNFYNRAQQPLSPYLNMLRFGDPGVNYFYGVRPGLSPSVSGVGGAFGFQGSSLGPPGTGNRFYLQPPAMLEELPSQPLEAARPLPVIPTAAHPVMFGNGPRIGGGYGAAQRSGFAAPQQASRGSTGASTPRR